MRRLTAMIIGSTLATAASAAVPAADADQAMARAGLLEVECECPRVKVELMYAGPDNFTGVTLYDASLKARLHPDAMQALQRADRALQAENPSLHLLVKDAARPMSVQRKMYNAVSGTPKARYVGNPAKGGGLHNYGLAVDVTLIDAQGRELPMGTPVDHLGPEANIDSEERLVEKGVITPDELQNRILLRRVMLEGGFKPLRTEWWHFNLCSRSEAARRYQRLNF